MGAQILQSKVATSINSYYIQYHSLSGMRDNLFVYFIDFLYFTTNKFLRIMSSYDDIMLSRIRLIN